MNKYVTGIAAVAAAGLTLTACTPPTETRSAPSSASAAPTDSELFREQAREGMSRLERNAELGIPGPVIAELAEVAVQDGTPLAFSWGGGSCAWIRTPDGSLWRLDGAGALARDDSRLAFFRANPGAMSGTDCDPTGSLPTRPDPAVRTAYRWLDGGVTKVSIDGHAYALPTLISRRGAVLVAEDSAGPTTPTTN